MAPVVFVDDIEFGSIGTIHFAKELEGWELYGGLRRVECGIWTQVFGLEVPHLPVQLAE